MIFAAAALAVLLVAVAARFWRIATWAALVLMVYEGALRKWFLPQFQQPIYFLKDGLLLGAYFGYFVGSRWLRDRAPFHRHVGNAILAFYALLCFSQLLNPRLPNIFVGLYGLQSYIMYVPLMYMVPELLPDQRALRRFVLGLVITAAIPLALGIVQFNLPPTHYLNQYVWSDQGIATFGPDDNLVRVTSTFSYISGYASYLSALAVLLLGLALSERSRWLRFVLVGGVAAVIVNLFMTGSRGPLLVVLLCVPFVVFQAFVTARKHQVKTALVLTLAIPIAVGAALWTAPDAQTAMTHRVTSNGNENLDRIKQIFITPIQAFKDAGFTGYGIGTTLPGSTFLYQPKVSDEQPPAYEGEHERVMIEIGSIGYFLVLLARLVVPLQLFLSLRKCGSPYLRPLIAAAFAITLVDVPLPIIINHTSGIIFWFLAGFAFLPITEARLSTRPLMRDAVAAEPAVISA
jgi:hypothetical protein